MMPKIYKRQSRKKALRELCETFNVNPTMGELFLSEIKYNWKNEKQKYKRAVILLGLVKKEELLKLKALD